MFRVWGVGCKVMALQRALGLFKSLGQSPQTVLDGNLLDTHLGASTRHLECGQARQSSHRGLQPTPGRHKTLTHVSLHCMKTYNFVGVTCSIEHASLRVPAQLDIYRYRPASWGMRPLTNKPASFTRLIMRILPSV